MTSVEIRKLNLQNILHELKKAAIPSVIFARQVGTNPCYLSQILSDKTHANIGNALARKIESATKKPMGWMDIRHDKDNFKIAGIKKEVEQLIKIATFVLNRIDQEETVRLNQD